MPNINVKSYVDIHTTGEKREFGSIKAYDKFLKEHGKMVLSKKELSERQSAKAQPKSDYKKVVEQAWKEREKFVQEVKYNKRPIAVWSERA